MKHIWLSTGISCSASQDAPPVLPLRPRFAQILRHLGLWPEGVRVHWGTDPPGETTLDPWLDDPFPDYDNEPVMAFSAT